MGQIYDSIKTFVLNNLPHDRTDVKTSAALEAMSIPNLLITYLNWQSRFIEISPRYVFESPQFVANPLRKEHEDEINLLISEIECGQNLNRRLSKKVKCGFALPRRNRQKPLNPTNRPDLDLLLNDWGIHHLHIGMTVTSDGFIQRGEFVLFAIFERCNAYLIDIYDHKRWAAKEVVATTIGAWPDKEFFLELTTLKAPREAGWTDDERLNLRYHGFSTHITIEDKIFIGRNGFTNAGTSVRTARFASYILRIVMYFDDNIEYYLPALRSNFAKIGVSNPEFPIFEFCFFQHGFGVIEKISGTPISLVRASASAYGPIVNHDATES